MKSLEHIIREIQEGKCNSEKKKDSLEHSIRKVVRKESSYAAKDSKPVDEDVAGMCGSTDGKTYGESGKKKVRKEDGDDKLPRDLGETMGLGTSDYQGSQFKSVRTAMPRIEPPKGADDHPQAPKNAARQRTLAKERTSQTSHSHMRAEETVDEGLVDTAAKTVFQYAKPYVASTSRALVKYGSKFMEKPSAEKETKDLPKPAETPQLPAPKKAETAPAVETKPKLPEVKPTDTKPTEVKTETKPTEVKSTEVKTDVKPAEVKQPEVKTDVKPATPAEPLPQVKPETKAAPPVEPPSKLGDMLKKLGPLAALAALGLKGGASSPDDKYLGKPHIIAPTRLHKAKHLGEEDRKDIENMPRKGDRKSIEYVGRKDADPKTTKEKTSRQATIKNVIDESKKLAGTIKTAVKEKEQKEGGNLDQPTKIFDYNPGDYIVIRPDLVKNSLDTKKT